MSHTSEENAPSRVWVKVRAGDSYTIKWGKEIVRFLENRGVEVYVDPLLGYSVNAKVLPETRLESLDMAIIVGGDGTLLRTVQKSKGVIPPILGFSAKSLGFFFEHNVENFRGVLEKVLRGAYKIYNVSLGGFAAGNVRGVFLNEVSLWAENGKVIEYELEVEGEKIYHARSDGIIINTPAGSTGHALSYNSPIFFCWERRLLSFIPVGALSPLIKPIVVAETPIKIRLLTWPALLIADGQRRLELKSGSVITATPGAATLGLVYTEGPLITPEKIRERLFDRGFSTIGG